MNKILAFILLVLLALQPASFADNGPTDQDYQSLARTRAQLIRMKHEMDMFIKDLAGSYSGQDMAGTGLFGRDVMVDVVENEKDVIVKADLPRMNKDKIDIILEKSRVLKISGSREIESKVTSPGVIRQERTSGHFERVLELPTDCDGSGIKAKYNEGVLEVTLPKKRAAKEDIVKVNIQ